MRCISLANKLKNNGAEVTFIMCSNSNSMAKIVKKNGHNIEFINNSTLNKALECEKNLYKIWKENYWQLDVNESKRIISKINPKWTIIDHYGLDYKWHQKIRNFNCDLLLDQTYARKYNDYKQLIPKGCRVLLGSDYTLLRDEFKLARITAINKRKKYNGINRILVSFGSMDYNNDSEKVLHALDSIRWHTLPKVDIVLSKNSPNYTKVKVASNLSPLNVHIFSNVKNMSDLMVKADIAIGAAGTTTWERCCLGLPSLVSAVADNQLNIVSALEKIKAIIEIEYPINSNSNTIRHAITKIINDSNLYRDMSIKSFEVCDGNGVERVSKLI